MSAVDEYHIVAQAPQHHGVDKLMAYSDAAIAELEAENERLTIESDTNNHELVRVFNSMQILQEAYVKGAYERGTLEAELAKTKWMLRQCMKVSTQYMAEHTGVEWHESDVDEALEHLNEAWAERENP